MKIANTFSSRGFLLGLVSLTFAIIFSFGCGATNTSTEVDSPEDTTMTYSFDSEGEVWNENVNVLAVPNGDVGSNTIIIQLKENEPVKEISLKEVLLINSPNEPTLEIAGSNDPHGEIHICKLIFKKVESEEFHVEDTEAVSMAAINVKGDNSIEITVNPVNDVRCGRGGVAVLALGVPTSEVAAAASEVGPLLVVDTDGHEGLLENRIKILGPTGNNGFIETLIVEDSSVFGRIELRHLRIQEFILDNVTVENL